MIDTHTIKYKANYHSLSVRISAIPTANAKRLLTMVIKQRAFTEDVDLWERDVHF